VIEPASIEARPRRAGDLYEGVARGRRFVHDPRGRDALVVLSKLGARVLDAADGRSVGALALALGAPLDAVAREVSVLGRAGMLSGRDVPPPPRPAPAPPTLDVWLHVTSTCNLDCVYCYVERGPGVLDDATAARVIDALVASARSKGVRRVHVRYAGGEPMLRFDVIQRFHARAKAALASIDVALGGAVLTNGTVIPDGALEWLVAERFGVSVSLDGVDEAHDRSRPTRGGAGSFAAAAAGLERYRAAGLQPYVLTTLSDRNLDALPTLARWLVEAKVGFRWSLSRDLESGDSLLAPRSAGWRRDGLVPLRRAAHRPEGQGSPMLEGEALARAIAVIGAAYDVIEARVPLTPSFFHTHRFCDLDLRRPIRRACGAGERSVAIGETGAISACQASLHRESSLLGDADELFARLGAAGSLARPAPEGPCAECRHRHSCAGGCPLLLARRDGHARGQSPYCALFKYVIPRILRIAAAERIARLEALPAKRAVEAKVPASHAGGALAS
jgi:uncharacterized protein